MTDDRHQAVKREYGALAPRYEEKWASYVAATARETLRRLPLKPGQRLLDVGCGTGALLRAILAAEPTASLTGIDLSPEMLAVARRQLPDHVELVVAPAQALPLPDDSFDVVVTTSAFHFFPAAEPALAEMRRVLRPGGALVITDWCDDFLACRIADRLLRRLSPAHVQAYGSGGIADLLAAAGFADVAVESYKISWLWGMMTASARKPE